MDHSKQAVDLFNKYAQAYEEKFMDVSLYHASFDFFCRSIQTKNAEILELACGPGNISKQLLANRPDFKLLGTDLSLNMIALAKKNNPTANFQLMDARDVGKLKSKFHGIMCGFCLPYLSLEETARLIKDASELMYPEGLLYLSTMEDDYSASKFQKGSQGDEIFMHYYTEEDLSPLIKNAGLTIIYTERIESIQTNGTQVIDLVLIAMKKPLV